MITAQIVRGTKQDATVGRIEEINMSGWINTDIRQRTNHKLDAWNEFVEILHRLPLIDQILN